MTNPLVADRVDSTTGFSGVPILESVDETKKALESGDWASGVLGAAVTGLDALGMALDPFGSILAAGVGWLMEHVGPLSDALDSLTGDPDEIKAHSETWKNVGDELAAINTEMADLVNSDTASWIGEAGDAYRARSGDTGKLLEAAQKGAEGASSGIGTAGEVVAAVRTLVRDIIAELVGRLVSWALQVLATAGIAMTWVVPQVAAAVAKVAAKIADITMKLVKALKALAPMLKKLGSSFRDAKKALDKIKADSGKNSGPKPPPNRPPKNDGPNSRGPQGGETTRGGRPEPKPNPPRINIQDYNKAKTILADIGSMTARKSHVKHDKDSAPSNHGASLLAAARDEFQQQGKNAGLPKHTYNGMTKEQYDAIHRAAETMGISKW
ncbi:WXG100 family type VII secretion target [Saccharopolyspora phatthalungensis]|uniref:Uncharacterized protein YukE n=1 Tax=Saccharopolyspora phatthalungensis TaxID=664693 RepID=A0A840QB32_9PSEU|nr:uncharacterized protein YukE [Saccharopolyspora phatthalungensis]